MSHSKPEDAVFGTCAGCTVLVVGAAFAALLYQLITAAVPLVELVMSQRMLMTMGF
jgi:hypothetical protein